MSGHREHALVGLGDTEGGAFEVMTKFIDAAEVHVVDQLADATDLTDDRLREILVRALVVDLAACVSANAECGLDAGDLEEIIVWLRHAHLNMTERRPAVTTATVQ